MVRLSVPTLFVRMTIFRVVLGQVFVDGPDRRFDLLGLYSHEPSSHDRPLRLGAECPGGAGATDVSLASDLVRLMHEQFHVE